MLPASHGRHLPLATAARVTSGHDAAAGRQPLRDPPAYACRMPPAFNATAALPDGAYEKPSQFSSVDALWVDGREIARVDPQDATGVAYDVRLTKQVIRDRRAALHTDPRVTLRPSTSGRLADRPRVRPRGPHTAARAAPACCPPQPPDQPDGRRDWRSLTPTPTPTPTPQPFTCTGASRRRWLDCPRSGAPSAGWPVIGSETSRAPGCPPPTSVTVRWRVSSSAVKRLDPLPPNCAD